MSSDLPKGRIALGDLVDRKGRRRILMSGAYTAPFARTLDRFVDVLLVDRAVARAIHGFPNAADATLEMMILHGQAVMRGSDRAAVLVELPTGTYESTSDRALHDAELLVEATGCSGVAVPIEVETIEVIRVLVDNAIPVLGLIEVGERAVATGSDDPDWLRIQTTRNVQAAVGAGAFGILAFGFDDTLLEDLTRTLRIPVLGAESAGVCDGQFLNDTEFLSMISAVKTASRTRPPLRVSKPTEAPVGGTLHPAVTGTTASPSTPAGTTGEPIAPRRAEPVATRTPSPAPTSPPIRVDPPAPRAPLPAATVRAAPVPPARRAPDPVAVPPNAAKAPISLSRPVGPAPTALPRPAPSPARPGPTPEAAQPIARARPPIAAPGSRPPPPSARADAGELLVPAPVPSGPPPAPPIVGTGSVPSRPPTMPPMRSPSPIAPPPPATPPAVPSIVAPVAEPVRPAAPVARVPSAAPGARAPGSMSPPRPTPATENRPADATATADGVELAIPVRMPPARTRRTAAAVTEEIEPPTAFVPVPAPEPAPPVRAETPEEEPTRLIVSEAPPVEEVTSSRIAWTGPAKPEKQTLFGALRGRLKNTPR